MREDSLLDWLRSKALEEYLKGAAADVIFECARCGQCCQGDAYAVVDDQDITRLACGIGSTFDEVRETFTAPDPENRPSTRALKNVGRDNLCVFYDASKECCSIYEFRPAVCNAFPMMNIIPGHRLMFNMGCLGSSHLVDTLHDKKDEIGIKKYMERLNRERKVLTKLQIKLFIHALQRHGLGGEAQDIAQSYDIELPFDEDEFRKACIAYLIRSIKLDEILIIFQS
jgi:Fe-S-cluster containining protein